MWILNVLKMKFLFLYIYFRDELFIFSFLVIDIICGIMIGDKKRERICLLVVVYVLSCLVFKGIYWYMIELIFWMMWIVNCWILVVMNILLLLFSGYLVCSK